MKFPVRKKLPHHVPQWVREGSWHFITINGEPRGRSQLCQPDAGLRILRALAYNHEKLVWHCRIGLLMPDHLHAVISFPRTPGMETSILNWKRFVSANCGIEWQRGFFDHRLRTEDEVREKTCYILKNPVRNELCASEDEWKWVYRPKDRPPPI